MRIGIDARLYGKEGKGIGRYAERLIKHLEEIDKENRYFIFLCRKNFSLYQPKNPNFQKVLVDIPCYSFKEQVVFPFALKKYRLDLIHFLHFNVPLIWRDKFVVTIHDLIHLQTGRQSSSRSAVVYSLKKRACQIVFRYALKKASKIISVSYFTKKEIEENFKLEKGKIEVIYEGVEDIARSEEPVRKVKKPYILYIGNAYPHKNLQRLMECFKTVYSKKKVQLVLVGKIDYFYQQLRDIVVTQNINGVVFTGEMKDEEIKWLYKNSLAYICPSLKEGFGLPGLEAMFYGCPVLCSKLPVLQEIYGSAALYFNPEATKQMAKAILKVIECQDLREKLKLRGYAQIRNYSWKKCAKQTFQVYQKIFD